MRYDKKELKNSKFDNDFKTYILDYIKEVESLGAEFKSVEISNEYNDEETFDYYFKVNDKFIENKEILNRDDDSQPHNSYRIYLGDLMIYETRYV